MGDAATNDPAVDDVAEIRARVLPHFDGWGGAAVVRIGGGLINRSYQLTRDDGGRAVLQAVNAIFPPEMHGNIVAVTDRLAAAGLVTPRLLPTRDGRPYVLLGTLGGSPSPPRDGLRRAEPASAHAINAAGGGLWRLLSYIDGVSFDVVAGPEQARAAGELVGRFHAAVDGMTHAFVGMRVGVHDTPRHLARLEDAVATHAEHRLIADVRPLARAILDGAAALPPLPSTLPPRICHGDLKFNNIMFAGRTPPADARAVCLIDLDTVGPLSLAFELGDAWRSWCNRAGEDDVNAVLDLEIMRASLDGYVAGLGRALTADERRALLLGVEWVSLELAARFAADALFESYFGWDPARFTTRGDHNLTRARGQWSLHQSLLATRPTRTSML